MSDILPTSKAVYTKDYWAPVPPMHNFRRRGTLSRLIELGKIHGSGGFDVDPIMDARLEEAMAPAITQLLASRSAEPIQQGELLGTSDDTKYAIPGNVLLVDTEAVSLFKVPQTLYDDDQRKQITDETEIEMPAINVFCNGLRSRSGSNAPASLLPYAKRYRNDGGWLYKRTVNVFGFVPNRQGQTVNVALCFYGIDDQGSVTVNAPAGHNKYIGPPHMEVYGRVGDTINVSIRNTQPEFIRIRSAYILARGAVELATARQPVRKRRALLGRLATNPVSS